LQGDTELGREEFFSATLNLRWLTSRYFVLNTVEMEEDLGEDEMRLCEVEMLNCLPHCETEIEEEE